MAPADEADQSADDAWLAHRLSLGVPEGRAEMGDILWLETNAVELHGVSFDKGCYVGQENTARMNWRQKVNRRLVVVPLAESDEKRRKLAYPELGLAVDHLRVDDLDPAALPDWQRAGVSRPKPRPDACSRASASSIAVARSRAASRGSPSDLASASPIKRIAQRHQHQRQRVARESIAALWPSPSSGAISSTRSWIVEMIGIERVLVAGQQHPAGQRARALTVERVESQIHHFARRTQPGAAGAHGIDDRLADRAREMLGQRLLQPDAEPKWCSRLAWVRPIRADNRLQRHRLRPRLDQQRARRCERGAARFLGRQSFACRHRHALVTLIRAIAQVARP